MDAGPDVPVRAVSLPTTLSIVVVDAIPYLAALSNVKNGPGSVRSDAENYVDRTDIREVGVRDLGTDE